MAWGRCEHVVIISWRAIFFRISGLGTRVGGRGRFWHRGIDDRHPKIEPRSLAVDQGSCPWMDRVAGHRGFCSKKRARDRMGIQTQPTNRGRELSRDRDARSDAGSAGGVGVGGRSCCGNRYPAVTARPSPAVTRLTYACARQRRRRKEHLGIGGSGQARADAGG